MSKKSRKFDAPIYHDEYKPMSLGCFDCPDQYLCGGLYAANGHYSCMGFCQCTDIQACNYVCKRDIQKFAIRSMEVRGFDLNNVPRCLVIAPPKLPLAVPLLYHGYSRTGYLRTPVVAVKFHMLFEHRTGRLKYNSRAEIAAKFRFDLNARLIIVGVADDPFIEPYWTVGRSNKLYAALAAIKPDLVTTPNFSTFANVVRWDNLHGMKRIAISWSELVSSGIPTSLHLNARTDRDWERWTDFICEREEVQSIAFEFCTGTVITKRGRYSVGKLINLAKTVPRNLQLVIEGGRMYLNALKQAFPEVVFIDTTSHMKSMKRKKFIFVPGKRDRWVHFPLPKGHPVDALLQHNVVEFAKSVERRSEPHVSIATATATKSLTIGT